MTSEPYRFEPRGKLSAGLEAVRIYRALATHVRENPDTKGILMHPDTWASMMALLSQDPLSRPLNAPPTDRRFDVPDAVGMMCARPVLLDDTVDPADPMLVHF